MKFEEDKKGFEIGQKIGFLAAFLIFVSILNFVIGKIADKYIAYKYLIPGVIVIYFLSLMFWRKK